MVVSRRRPVARAEDQAKEGDAFGRLHGAVVVVRMAWRFTGGGVAMGGEGGILDRLGSKGAGRRRAGVPLHAWQIGKSLFCVSWMSLAFTARRLLLCFSFSFSLRPHPALSLLIFKLVARINKLLGLFSERKRSRLARVNKYHAAGLQLVAVEQSISAVRVVSCLPVGQRDRKARKRQISKSSVCMLRRGGNDAPPLEKERSRERRRGLRIVPARGCVLQSIMSARCYPFSSSLPWIAHHASSERPEYPRRANRVLTSQWSFSIFFCHNVELSN